MDVVADMHEGYSSCVISEFNVGQPMSCANITTKDMKMTAPEYMVGSLVNCFLLELLDMKQLEVHA